MPRSKGVNASAPYLSHGPALIWHITNCFLWWKLEATDAREFRVGGETCCLIHSHKVPMNKNETVTWNKPSHTWRKPSNKILTHCGHAFPSDSRGRGHLHYREKTTLNRQARLVTCHTPAVENRQKMSWRDGSDDKSICSSWGRPQSSSQHLCTVTQFTPVTPVTQTWHPLLSSSGIRHTCGIHMCIQTKPCRRKLKINMVSHVAVARAFNHSTQKAERDLTKLSVSSLVCLRQADLKLAV